MPSACNLPNGTSSENTNQDLSKDLSETIHNFKNGYIDDGLDEETLNNYKQENLAETPDKIKQDQELVFIHDTAFTVKIAAPGLDVFEIQVSSTELVQEIHHLLMDREDTCSRTCFSLNLNGNTLDYFTELKNIEGFKEGVVIKVVKELYTVREARIHVRHIRDLIKSLDSADAYNGQDCNSLSFLNVIAQGDILEKKKGNRSEMVDCTPPSYILPGVKDLPLCALQPQTKDQKSPQALKILTVSGWNPPPGLRKLHGDLLYLYVVTMEDKRYHITSSTKGFYVNMSTDEEFNPKAKAPIFVHHSLIDLLSSLSPIFKKSFTLIQKKRHQKHPFERVSTPYQVYSWTAPNLEHTVDSIRAEDAFSSKLGYEEHIPCQTRDWNEELQTTRELPRKTLPERLLRERAIFKVHNDFVAAATRGAIAVVDGNVLAINPGENQKMQMFIWYNIFFSLGFDIRNHYKELGGDNAAFVAPNNDLQGVKAYSSVDIEGLYTLGTVIIDYRGFRVSAQSIIPGILEREQEQSIMYGSIDFGKTIVTNEKHSELLKQAGNILKIMPHKILNEKDEVIEIYSSVECKGIVGNDGRYYVLDLLRTFPPDVNYFPIPIEEYHENTINLGYPKKFKHNLCCLRYELLESFVEFFYLKYIKLNSDVFKNLNSSKELENTENKKEENIETDKLVTETEKKSEVKKENGDSNESELKNIINNNLASFNDDLFMKFESEIMKILDMFDHSKNDKESKHFNFENSLDFKKVFSNTASYLKDSKFDIRFNPDVYSPTVRHDLSNLEELNKQKEIVKDAAKFLLAFQIPKFVSNCLNNIITPLDGSSLTEILHSKGINIRYLGFVAKLISKFESLDYLHSITVTELICRSAKHVFTNYIQNVDITNMASSVSLFLNCLLSACKTTSIFNISEENQYTSKPSKRKNRKKKQSNLQQHPTEWTGLTSKLLLDNIKEDLKIHYSYDLEGSTIESIIEKYNLYKICILRSFCLKTGIQILLREYEFNNLFKPTFNENDILNIFPVVKHVQPKATDAFNFYTTGQAKIQQGKFKEGYDLIIEALNLFNNVYGAMHSEIIQCLRMLARLNYLAGEYSEAMTFQQKVVFTSEKVKGIDHSSTITEYTYLALYCFANQQVTIALKLLYRARYLLLLNCGNNHPELAVIDSNIGLILHSVGEYEISLQFLKNALALNKLYYGPDSLKAAVSYDLIARSQSCMGDFRSALHNEKETYSIYKRLLGENHAKSIESSESLKHLTKQAIVLQKKINELSKAKVAVNIPSLQIQPPSISSILQILNVINGIIHLQKNLVIKPPFQNEIDLIEKKIFEESEIAK